MANDPAFLFYTNDFDSKTKFFTHEQVGLYIRLLMAQHQHGHLSKQQIDFISGGEVDKIVFAKFEEDENGLFFNNRLEEEIIKRKKFSESRRKNRLGSTSKKQKKKKSSNTSGNTSKSYVNHMENEDENDNEDKNEYEIFVSEWFSFFEERELPKPGFDGAQGKALKGIISKVKESSRNGTNPIDSFKYILKNWHMQTEWIQSNALDLKVFNQKFNVIIDNLKNGRSKTSFTKFAGEKLANDPNYKAL